MSAQSKEEEEIKAKKAKVAAMSAGIKTAMNDMSEKEKKAMKARILAGKDEELKAAVNSIPDLSYYGDNVPDENSTKTTIEGDGKTVAAAIKEMTTENEKLKASISAMEDELTASRKTQAEDYREQMLQHKASIVPGLDQKAYTAKLAEFPFKQLKAMYDDRKDEIDAVNKARGGVLTAGVKNDAPAFNFATYGDTGQVVGEFTSVSSMLGGRA